MNTFGSLTVIPDNKRGRGRILLSSGSAEDAMLLDKVREHFTRPNPAYRFCPGLDPTSCPISAGGSVRIGFIPTVIEVVTRFSGSIEVDPILEKQYHPGPLGGLPVVKDAFSYRDYQEQAVIAALEAGRGIILLPTSAGKSLCAYGIAYGILPKVEGSVLILVPTTNLVEQFYKDMLEYGAVPNSVFKFSGKNKTQPGERSVIITNRQYLQNHLDDLPLISAVIGDEIHTTSLPGTWGAKFFDSLQTPYKFGMTATLPDSDLDKFGVLGIIGPVLSTKNVGELQDKGYIAQLDVVSVKIHHEGFKEPKHTEYEDICQAYIYECERIEASMNANKVIASLADGLASSGLNVILLFDHTEHGKTLFSLIKSPLKWFINGSTDVINREDARGEMEQSQGSVIVSQTKVFGTGVNIKKLHAVVLACPGKSSTKVLQAIGRTLRPHTSKNKALVYDIHHDMKYSLRHFAERTSLYRRYYGIQVPPPKIIRVEFLKEPAIDIE